MTEVLRHSPVWNAATIDDIHAKAELGRRRGNPHPGATVVERKELDLVRTDTGRGFLAFAADRKQDHHAGSEQQSDLRGEELGTA